MTRSWQLQEAKNKLSEVIRRAKTEGPQEITVRGETAVVVISADEYRKSSTLVASSKRRSAWDMLYDPERPKLTDEEMDLYFGRRDDMGRELPDFGK